MIQFIVRRFLIFIPMLFLMSVVAFAIIQAPPGDFLTDYIAQLQATGELADESEVEALRAQYGLNQPIYVQYLKWVYGIIQWDLGLSIEWRRPVKDLVNERLAMTVLLGVATILFTWTLAIPIGILSAVKKYTVIDYFFTFLSYFGVGTPNFMIALVAMWFAFSWFGVKATGLFSDEYITAPWSVGKFIDLIKHLWLPMLILGTDGTARFTRIVRANLLDEMNKPYVETARAKGLPEWKVVLKYPVRIALNPFVSTAGLELPRLISGQLIVATVMSLPTIGPLLLRALLSQDMYMAGSIVLILTTLTLIGVLISDIVLAAMDPRIRIGA
ncbi:MAG: ABC transporter permease [Chloroflexota bacterium]|nr:ABC transporter permease [Chloroflexota bacterium]MDE2688066.1 ABC transporter permease [Chloroflexota bacterium]